MSYGRLRWVIVGLLAAATTMNYIDRQTLSILSPLLRKELHLSDADYANIVTAFLVPYTLMYALGGKLVDRVGARVGLTIGLAWWSVATMLTAFVRTPGQLGACRFLLGLGEPCVYPAGVKVCGEWFPERLRATATGIFSAGSSAGALIAPPLIALLTLQFGWQAAFLVPGVIGLFWLPLWWRIYRPIAVHPQVSDAERMALEPERDAAQSKPSYRALLGQRAVWGLLLARLLSDPVWYFYLFWLPDYLQRERGLSMAEIGMYGWVPFLFADLGSIGGGMISDALVRRGMDSRRARLVVLAMVGTVAPLGALAGVAPGVGMTIAITCLVAWLTQCWSTNTATLAADLVPGEATATVFGMMGTAGSLAGACFAQVLGQVIGHFGYPGAFALAACLHPLAAILLWRLTGMRKVNLT